MLTGRDLGKRFSNISLEKGKDLAPVLLGKGIGQGGCFLECSFHYFEHLILCPQTFIEHLLEAKHSPAQPCLPRPHMRTEEEQEKQIIATEGSGAPEPTQRRGEGTEVTEGGRSVRAAGRRAELTGRRRPCGQRLQCTQHTKAWKFMEG